MLHFGNVAQLLLKLLRNYAFILLVVLEHWHIAVKQKKGDLLEYVTELGEVAFRETMWFLIQLPVLIEPLAVEVKQLRLFHDDFNLHLGQNGWGHIMVA